MMENNEMVAKLKRLKDSKEFKIEDRNEDIERAVREIEELLKDIVARRHIAENAQYIQKKANELVSLAIQYENDCTELKMISRMLGE